jgi:hypothetical protein
MPFSLVDVEMLKCDVQIMLDTLGTDPTEQACESECHKLLAEGNVMHFGCPLVCHGYVVCITLTHTLVYILSLKFELKQHVMYLFLDIFWGKISSFYKLNRIMFNRFPLHTS